MEFSPAIVKRYIECPGCQHRFNDVDALLTQAAEQPPTEDWQKACAWCGRVLTIRFVDGQMLMHMNTEGPAPSSHTVTLLKLPPQKHPLFLFVRTTYDGSAYWFEEHTCPTNWIDKVEQLTTDEDQDPHNLFEYVDAVQVNADYSTHSETAGRQEGSLLFPKVFAYKQYLDDCEFLKHYGRVSGDTYYGVDNCRYFQTTLDLAPDVVISEEAVAQHRSLELSMVIGQRKIVSVGLTNRVASIVNLANWLRKILPPQPAQH